MIRWMCGHMRLDKIRNEVIKSKFGVAFIDDKMRYARLRSLQQKKALATDKTVTITNESVTKSLMQQFFNCCL